MTFVNVMTGLSHRGADGVSAIPVLESEAVTRDLPDRLIIVGRSLGCQQKVLVEEALFVSLERYGAAGHHQQCRLALSCLFMNRLTVQDVNFELARRQRLKKLAQSVLSGHGVPVPHQGGLVQVEPGQVPPFLVHAVIVNVDEFF